MKDQIKQYCKVIWRNQQKININKTKGEISDFGVSTYTFAQIATIGVGRLTLDFGSGGLQEKKLKQQVCFRCCVTLLPTAITYELKGTNY